MKHIAKLFIIVLALSTALYSCRSNTCAKITTVAPASETTAVKAFLDSKGLTATLDSRGFYYTIQNAGSSTKPDVCNTVEVRYKGMFTNGVVFDEVAVGDAPAPFPLGNLITGWQEGIPLIGTGGRITLYLPPTLAYGAKQVGTIPANSILVFEIDLVGIK